MKKTLYVVWKMYNGALGSDTITIEGKINHRTVKEAVENKLGYYDKDDLDRIISWQEEDSTFEEYSF